jgi:hypothetical protein
MNFTTSKIVNREAIQKNKKGENLYDKQERRLSNACL